MSPASPRAKFAQLVERDEGLPLAEAALLIAGEEYPLLDPEPYLARLDDYAARLRQRVRPNTGRRQALEALNHLLFEEEMFEGNEDDYYDPRNSFLNEVLDRKLGIPISLSLVYMEVGRRAGLPLSGVGLPGHFLVTWHRPEPAIYLDPFHHGRFMTEAECADRVESIYQGRKQFSDEHLQPVPPRLILARLLSNLKNIYVESRSYAKGYAAIDKLVTLLPGMWNEVRDRGLVLYQLRQYRRALADLEAYVRNVPNAEDKQDVQRMIKLVARKWEDGTRK